MEVELRKKVFTLVLNFGNMKLSKRKEDLNEVIFEN